MATPEEFSEFLKSVQLRAFKRSVYHVKDTQAALDIVQDSMLKLSEHYVDKPISEIPLLFQRILSNTVLDWLRHNKTHRKTFSNFSELEEENEEGGQATDILEVLQNLQDVQGSQGNNSSNPEDSLQRTQTMQAIELAIENLPARQREAFLMRYWEEFDVAQTAAAMGCTQGSVKTHCSRAIASLGAALKAQGIRL